MGFLSFKSFKIALFLLALLGAEAYAIIAVPTTSAYHNPPNAGDCGQYLQITTAENPSCDASTNGSLNESYAAIYSVKSLGKALNLKVNTQTWYCTDPYPHDGSDPSLLACRKSLNTNAFDADVPANGTKDIALSRNLDQAACGSAQTDMNFDVFVDGQKVCSYGNANFVFGFSFCSTGKTCGQATLTPTQQPSFSPKPSATPTPTCTPTPIASVTPSQNTTSTSTGAPTATAGPTPTSAPAATATPTPGQNIIINVSQSQSQSQQVLAAATVAPAPTTTQLPSTGSGTDILFALGTLIPLGWKMRKWK